MKDKKEKTRWRAGIKKYKHYYFICESDYTKSTTVSLSMVGGA